MRILIISLIYLSVVTNLVCAGFDYQSYQRSTYQEIKKQHVREKMDSGFSVSMSSYKYAMPVIFTKELRKLSEVNRKIITEWQTALRVPPGFADLYQHEFKAVFNSETIWIPVQEPLLLPMSSELHAGDRFKLYAIVIGVNDYKPVIIATEFKSDRAPE